jgi:hypothetical protein
MLFIEFNIAIYNSEVKKKKKKTTHLQKKEREREMRIELPAQYCARWFPACQEYCNPK